MITISSRTNRLRAQKTGYLQALPCALALVAAYGGVSAVGGSAEAKTPGETYCYYGTCHRVKSIAETEALVGYAETLPSSFYDSCKKDSLNPCGLTSSGEVFNPDAPDNAASPIYPDGTTLLVWSPETREAAVLRVNNAGPYWGDRKLDVSRATAERLGFKDRGVADLQVRVIGAPATEEQATYQKNRTYDRLPGYIGQYQSLDAAHAGMAAAMALEAMAPSVLGPLAGGAVAAARAAIAAPPAVVASTAPAAEVAVNAPPEAAAAPVKAEPPKPAAVAALAPAPEAAAKPVTKVAALVAPEAGQQHAAAAETRPAAQPKARDTRVARNNRLAKVARLTNVRKNPRVAARATARKAKPVLMAKGRLQPEPRPRSPMTADGPNDMSVFSRHAQPGSPRVAKAFGHASTRRSTARVQGRPAYRET
jgi:rare lipoprotein A